MAADEPVVEVWPDNWPAVSLFSALGTQWRIGFAGATGLDYAAIEPVLRLLAVPPAEWLEMFSAIRLMEGEALDQMRETADMKTEGAT
jgi:hypothetical protein